MLKINRQVRAEVIDLLRQSPFTLRITWQDKQFDSLALSSFIVQQRRKSYNVPHLVVEIWPPHPDRPIDAYYIYEHLRLLREDLRGFSRIPKLDVVFLENNVGTWIENGKLSNSLGIDDPASAAGPDFSDMSLMMELFERLTNVGTARIFIPDSFVGERYQELRELVQTTEEIIMGTWDPEPDAEMEQIDAILEKIRIRRNLPEDFIEYAEPILKVRTARIARKKLQTTTKFRKMKELEYDEFTEIWPHFEFLDEYEEDGEFCESNYVISDDWRGAPATPS